MKIAKTLLSALVLLAAVCEGRVAAVRTLGPDKTPRLEREIFRGSFDACSLNLEYSLENGEITARKDWGRYFFGITQGFPPTPKNGGWNRWNFLQVYAHTKSGKVENVLQKSRPVLFTGYSSGGADYLVAAWRTEEGRLFLRFVAFPSYPGWLFLQVDFSGMPIKEIVLSAYPGNAAAAEGRERHLASKEHDWHLNVGGAEFKPVSPLLLLYSRYVDDQFGNKLVYDTVPIDTVFSGKTTTGITLRFTPKKDAKTASFALAQFMHKDPSDQLVRFLGEDGDSIHNFLKGIDWKAAPDRNEFKRSAGIALSMGVGRERIAVLARAFAAAADKGDVAGSAEALAKVEALRREKVSAGLEALK